MRRSTLYKRVAELRRELRLPGYSRKGLNRMTQSQLMRELGWMVKAKGQTSLFEHAGKKK